MSVFDWFTSDAKLPDDIDRMVMGGFKRYGEAMVLGQLSDNIIDRLTGRYAYDQENRKLDLALKRRALGMQDSDDYEESVNNETALWAKTGRELLQRIPEPGFLSPKYPGPGKVDLKHTFKIGLSPEYPHANAGKQLARIIRALR